MFFIDSFIAERIIFLYFVPPPSLVLCLSLIHLERAEATNKHTHKEDSTTIRMNHHRS